MREIKEKVDVGVIAIREDEFAAVLRKFDDDLGEVPSSRRVYNLRRVETVKGDAYRVAVVRCIEQGNGEAQEAARDLLDDLEPQWIVVVGIAGGVPASEFTLGDVVAPTRICDFSVEAVLKDHSREYALAGGPLERDVTKLIANLPAMGKALGGWNAPEEIGMARPPVQLLPANYYGDDQWRAKVEQAMTRHFASAVTRDPRVTSGAIASSDRLIKDDEILAVFLRIARQAIAVEMESAGIYRATQPKRVPFLAIRGISDIVGFKRDPEWTEYACRSAASFAHAFLRARPIEPRSPSDGHTRRPNLSHRAGSMDSAPRESSTDRREPAKDRLDQILSRGVFRCGCVKHPPLCDFEWPEGRLRVSGLYIDMCRAVGEETTLEIEFVPVDWSELSRAFGPSVSSFDRRDGDELDLDIVLSVFETRQRQTFGDFTASFYTIGVGGVTRAGDDRIKSVQDLSREDVKVVVTKGEVGWEYVVHEFHVPKRRLIVVENSDITATIDYVLSSRATVAICDALSCQKLAEADPRLRHVFQADPLYLCKNSIMLPLREKRLAQWVLEKFRNARKMPAICETEQRILTESRGIIRRFT